MDPSFDRLLDLARKTGDRLIIYDRYSGEHLVVMGVDEYEMLAADRYDEYDCRSDHEFGDDVCDLSDSELIDKINRDISIWRSANELDEHEIGADAFKKHAEQEAFDPFEEDFTYSDDWHKVGEVLDESHPEFAEAENLKEDEFKFEESDDRCGNFDFKNLEDEVEEEKKGSSPISEDDAPKPILESTSSEGMDVFEDEPLSEEPIFFEEPVE